jgi:hypothetical protein
VRSLANIPIRQQWHQKLHVRARCAAIAEETYGLWGRSAVFGGGGETCAPYIKCEGGGEGRGRLRLLELIGGDGITAERGDCGSCGWVEEMREEGMERFGVEAAVSLDFGEVNIAAATKSVCCGCCGIGTGTTGPA